MKSVLVKLYQQTLHRMFDGNSIKSRTDFHLNTHCAVTVRGIFG